VSNLIRDGQRFLTPFPKPKAPFRPPPWHYCDHGHRLEGARGTQEFEDARHRQYPGHGRRREGIQEITSERACTALNIFDWSLPNSFEHFDNLAFVIGRRIHFDFDCRRSPFSREGARDAPAHVASLGINPWAELECAFCPFDFQLPDMGFNVQERVCRWLGMKWLPCRGFPGLDFRVIDFCRNFKKLNSPVRLRVHVGHPSKLTQSSVDRW